MLTGGEGGIRTPDAGITDVTVFETAAFNHSATSPSLSVSTRLRPFKHPALPRLLTPVNSEPYVIGQTAWRVSPLSSSDLETAFYPTKAHTYREIASVAVREIRKTTLRPTGQNITLNIRVK